MIWGQDRRTNKEFYEAVNTRRSVRDFTDEAIPEEVLMRIMETAKYLKTLVRRTESPMIPTMKSVPMMSLAMVYNTNICIA